MSARPFYKRYASDFVAGVAGLQAAQIGVYAVLLDLMYARRRKLETKSAKDVQGLARACGCNTRQFNRILAELIAIPNKITRDAEGRLSNPRFDRLMKDGNDAQTYPQENGTGAKNGDFSAILHAVKPHDKQHVISSPPEQDQGLNGSVGAPTSRARASHIPDSKKTSSSFGGGNGTTGMPQAEMIARFQKTLAESFGTGGWTIVKAATNAKADRHAQCLALCKAQARKLGKGWPKAWPLGG